MENKRPPVTFVKKKHLNFIIVLVKNIKEIMTISMTFAYIVWKTINVNKYKSYKFFIELK